METYGDVFEGYKDLQMHFWSTFSNEVGYEVFSDSKKAIEVSRVVARLLSREFAKRFLRRDLEADSQ
jgi:hypothetical protein